MELPVMTISAAIALAVFLAFAKMLRQRRHGGLPPGPAPLPLLGNLHLLPPPVHQSIHKYTAKYGPLCTLYFGSIPCVIAGTADTARELLKDNDTGVADRPTMVVTRMFAYDTAGFAFAPYGPYWRFMKKLCVSELLGPRTVERLAPVRRTELLALIDTFRAKAARGEAAEVNKELMKMTNSAIMRMAAGGAPEELAVEVRGVLRQVTALMGAFNLQDFVALCGGLDLQGFKKRTMVVQGRFDALLEKIMKEKEEARRRSGGSHGDGGNKDLVDILLDAMADKNAEVQITREHIKAFIIDIFTAGTDSSAASIEWALSELIKNPEMMRRLRDEIHGVVGQGRIVDEADLPKLPYLNAVMKETLRLHAPVPITHRKSRKEIQIRGYTIPPETYVYINLWAVGRDPACWDSPTEFQPERFLPPAAGAEAVDVKGQHFQVIPFGSGRRGCPGIVLALQTVPATLAALVQCFDWGSGAAINMEEGPGLVCARANPLVVVPRERLDPFPSP